MIAKIFLNTLDKMYQKIRFCPLWNVPGPRICRRTPSAKVWEPHQPALPFWKSWCRWDLWNAKANSYFPPQPCVRLPGCADFSPAHADGKPKAHGHCQGEADPEGFTAGIEEMDPGAQLSDFGVLSEDAQKLFQAERVMCVCFSQLQKQGYCSRKSS